MNKKNILVTDLSTIVAGSQKVTFNIIDGLHDKGFNLHVLCRRKESDVKKFYSRYSKNYFILDNLIEVIFGTGSFSLKKLSFFKKLKISFLVFMLNIQVLLTAIINKTKIIYCYDPKGIIASALFTKILGFKIIWHLHGELNFGKKINTILCNLSTKIIVPSQYIHEKIKEYKDSTIIYNGFNFPPINKFSFEKPKDEELIRLIFIGTLTPQKGLHTIIQSLSKINSKNKYIINIIGDFISNDNNYKNYLNCLIEKLPDNISIIFHGWVNDPYPYIVKSDVLLFPSIKKGSIQYENSSITFSSSEALPTVIIEALAMNIPVIATNIAGTKEIITSPNYGTIIDDFLEINLDTVINNLLINKNINTKNIREKFYLETMLNKIEILF
ncbi:glycosyltransferase [Proteus mirabilis]|uniref:glycosyltransferase n=1 Tax=Proteus mirabilis TaxID=584 RepID=UPI001A2EF0E2|nr:glycosyltransferase [Proteus mirabilis]MDH7534850.1 glycosyltransferase [Proteus mirabilis]MDM3630247.1 glycosyltransferase [Proteus mirabilis]MDM3641462.1 glycosyltransferase [Proteus mirabilis]MDM3710237.1 glycosyltransferase [Proteus mirabilis]MDM3783527.1 glycosyltransferase [Proteus mirabilis]